MELGEKLKNARLEAGLSQRQLCGDEITRNMLSQIEHGTARPSMDTLLYLAERLGKPVSFFLEEGALSSPNRAAMERARRCWDLGDAPAALEALAGYVSPDDVYDREKNILEISALLSLARRAVEEKKLPLALELLDRAEKIPTPYCSPALERERLLLLAKIRKRGDLPSLDEELLVRAHCALEAGDAARAARLLDAAENRSAPEWNLLRGKAYLTQANYAAAAENLSLAESNYPAETVPLLEQCFRELGDFKRAYEYAVKLRDKL